MFEAIKISIYGIREADLEERRSIIKQGKY
jgi:hypothetical protein